MAASFLALPAELRLMVYPHILSASSHFENISTILALRLSCRRVNLDITHEFIITVDAYHTQQLAASEYYTMREVPRGSFNLEKFMHQALENVRYVHPQNFVDLEMLMLEVPLQDFVKCADSVLSIQCLFPFWTLFIALPKQVPNIVIIIRSPNTGVVTAKNGAPAWFDLVSACSRLAAVTLPSNTDQWPLNIETHWSVPVKELPSLKSGASLRHHYQRKGRTLQEEGEKSVMNWLERQGATVRLVFGSSEP